MKKQPKPSSFSSRLLLRLVTGFIVALVAACVAVLLAREWLLFYLFSAATVGLCAWSYFVFSRTGNVVAAFYRAVIERLALPNSEVYNRFALPVVLLAGDQVVWYNARFRAELLQNEDAVGTLPAGLLPPAAMEALSQSGRCELEHTGRWYTVFASFVENDGNPVTVLYYLDSTEQKRLQRELALAHPVVAVLSIDSYDEITDDMAESDQAGFKWAIDREIERFTAETTGITRKLRNNRYLSVMDERSFAKLAENRFAVLDSVRSLAFPGGVKATLSIGVGRGEPTLKQCEGLAVQALEMAQGRGGDQAAIKTGDSYQFFGGVSGTVIEKRTKVKTRMAATALRELMRESDRVFFMGHRFGDADSLGACYALWRCAADLGKESFVVVNEATHLAPSLLAAIRRQGGGEALLTGEAACELVSRKSLLVICDTHRREFLEHPPLFDACRTSVVIDHHRKNTDFINNSVIFYHEPYASSTCELVSELISYMNSESLQKPQAEALLAGIMLDTRNFVLRTGVRTFEASAFLRSRGADPVAVKKLFSEPIDVYRERAMLVSGAEFYGPFAVATAHEGVSVSRVAASQAADELLNIERVDASFVLFVTGGTVNVSARSLGNFNVQLVMEALGGGGHHTMAAAQLEGISLDDTKSRLLGVLQSIHRKDVE